MRVLCVLYKKNCVCVTVLKILTRGQKDVGAGPKQMLCWCGTERNFVVGPGKNLDTQGNTFAALEHGKVLLCGMQKKKNLREEQKKNLLRGRQGKQNLLRGERNLLRGTEENFSLLEEGLHGR